MTAPKGDAFTARVQEAQKSETNKPSEVIKLTLDEAASQLESKIRNCPQNARGALLMKHIKIIGEMENNAAFFEKAAELRKLCEEQPNVNA